MTTDDVVVVVGTRPEAVKLAPIVTNLADRAVLVHTGQHYDTDMWASVIGDLGLPEPARSVAVGGLSRGEQIGEATTGLTRLLRETRPRAIVVQGDTNSTLAGALAGNATGTFVVHVEAGLRSGDPTMPEESNRLLTDRVADLCCAPIAANADNLRREGVTEDRILVSGNTLMEAMRDRVPDPGARAATRSRLGVPDHYVLSTLHRAATVDDPDRLRSMLTGLADLTSHVPVVLPLHPHTRARVHQFGLDDLASRLTIIAPVVPADFLALEADAQMIASDSGGVTEEAVLVRVPLVVLRDSTERPELLGDWSELLGRRDAGEVLAACWDRVDDWRASLVTAASPYGDEPAAPLIVAALDAQLDAQLDARSAARTFAT